jgi:hypothetical protein
MAELAGGCLCGAVRYALSGAPVSGNTLCHCRTCRRASGAPAVAWATFRRADFAWTRGRPVEHRSSPPVLRGFCGACGSALSYTSDHEPDTLDITSASLDDPEALPLEDHIWTADGLSWMQVDDGLPHFRQRRRDR